MADQVSTNKQASIWQLYRALVGIGIVCATLIVSVYLFTKPLIAANRQAAIEQAIFKVLPGAESYQAFSWQQGQLKRLASETDPFQTFYAGYDVNQQLQGFALLAQGRGYQDVIVIMYGYDPTQQAIVGMQVLESRETPGLGDKIAFDPEFAKNFVALDASWDVSTNQLLNSIIAVKKGEKANAWEIDGITGATISSVAIADILAHSTTNWIPILRGELERLALPRSADDV